MFSAECPVFVITPESVAEFCDDNDEAMLADDELQELQYLISAFLYSWLGEAIHELRHRST